MEEELKKDTRICGNFLRSLAASSAPSSSTKFCLRYFRNVFAVQPNINYMNAKLLAENPKDCSILHIYILYFSHPAGLDFRRHWLEMVLALFRSEVGSKAAGENGERRGENEGG